jgi:hypothetical protein
VYGGPFYSFRWWLCEKGIHLRELPLAEMFMQFLKYPTIITTFKYEYVPTQPMAERPILKKKSYVTRMIEQGRISNNGIRGPCDLDAGSVFPCFRARKNLELSGSLQFDPYQVLSFLDNAFQPGSADRITMFGLRDPALRWVQRPPKYLTWFTLNPIPDYVRAIDADCKTQVLTRLLSSVFEHSIWVDGLGQQIKVRKAAVPKILDYIEAIPERHVLSDFGSFYQRDRVQALFRKLNGWCEDRIVRTRHSQELAERFLEEGSDHRVDRLPIYWFRTARATETESFLFHLLLSLGSFSTEFQLLSRGSLRDCFIHARLFTDSDNEEKMKESCLDLLRRYVTTQLVHVPAGTRTFDQQLVAAHQLLCGFLLPDCIVCDSLPAALFTQVRQQTMDNVKDYCQMKKEILIDGLLL